MRPVYRSTASTPLRAAAILVALLVALTACDAIGGSDGSPGPDATNGPQRTARPTPRPTLPPGAVILEARDRQFSADEIVGVANVPTVVYFTNHDEMNHGLSIYRNASRDLELFHGDIFSGPGVSVVYEIPALPAGDYYFECSVHASMHGVFTVRPAPAS